MSMNKFVNETVKNLPPSGIREFFDIVTEMEDAISLGVGEPDFITPWNIIESAIYCLEHGDTHYTSNWGLLELRCAISQYITKRYSLCYSPKNQILVTVGASEGIDLALRAILRQGDEVIVPEPTYVSYSPGVILAGGNVVPIRTTADDMFKLLPKALEDAITDKTRAIILPFPNNPTGATMTKEELEGIVEVLEKHENIAIISDEIYAELTYTDERHVSIAEFPTVSGKYL